MAGEFGPGLIPEAQAAVDRMLREQAAPPPAETRQPEHRTERGITPRRERVPPSEPTPQTFAFPERTWEDRLAGAERAAARMAVPEQTENADTLQEDTSSQTTESPFGFLHDRDPSQIINTLLPEHPQTVALVLSHLPAEQTAQMISGLPPAIQADIAERIATMHPTEPDVVRAVETQLKQKLGKTAPVSMSKAGGIPHLVAILNNVDEATERTILETLYEQNPELAEEIEKNMFTVEDIARLSDRDMQRLIRELDQDTMVRALRLVPEAVKERFLANMSNRNRETLLEDMRYQPIPQNEVWGAQDEILTTIRRLTQEQELTSTEEAIRRRKENPLIDAEGNIVPLNLSQERSERLRAKTAAAARPAAPIQQPRRHPWPFGRRGGQEPPGTGTVPQ